MVPMMKQMREIKKYLRVENPESEIFFLFLLFINTKVLRRRNEILEININNTGGSSRTHDGTEHQYRW